MCSSQQITSTLVSCDVLFSDFSLIRSRVRFVCCLAVLPRFLIVCGEERLQHDQRFEAELQQVNPPKGLTEGFAVPLGAFVFHLNLQVGRP